MPISVNPSTNNLRWTDFTISQQRPMDPADGTRQDAYTSFTYVTENKNPRKVGDLFAFPDPWRITIAPKAAAWANVAQTPGLLSHEQFHYDVGIVCARAMGRYLAGVRTKTAAELLPLLTKAVQLHLHRRAGLLQRHYDRETGHGTNPHAQRRWKQQMALCLANPNAQMLGGWWL